jgi:uncharacterized protein (TIGR02271 family)
MTDTTVTMDELMSGRGRPVYSTDGEKIGSIEEIFVDGDTNDPEWIGLGTGFFGMKRVLVPVQGAAMREDGVLVPYTKDHVKDTPDIDSDEISQETEASLYAHYGLDYSEQRSATGLPEGRKAEGFDTGLGAGAVPPDSPGDRADGSPSVTRSEEELAVGKRETEAGRVRLHKWVETEPAQMDVELKRETARVTREPVDEPVDDAEIGEEEIEVPLRAEEAVAEKRTVAKERIGIEKDVETEHETVSDELRKERVEVEGDQRGRKR